MSTPPTAIDLPSGLASRRPEMYPQLTDAEIARIGHFGQVRRYERGEQLFAAGEPAPGMFVMLKTSRAVLASRRHQMFPVLTEPRSRASAASAPCAATTAASTCSRRASRPRACSSY